MVHKDGFDISTGYGISNYIPSKKVKNEEKRTDSASQ
jgi:hypothetical protein